MFVCTSSWLFIRFRLFQSIAFICRTLPRPCQTAVSRVSEHLELPKMHGSATVQDLDEHLDVLAPLMPFKLYTQICFCFSLADDSSDSAILDTLSAGLERLSVGFPWLAGQVIREASDEGAFKIKTLEKIPRMIVKDLRNDAEAPTMDALRRAGFSFGLLDEAIVAPCTTLPGSSDEPAPVFLLQANFIAGGLLLTVVSQHNTMDMVGQDQVTRLLSKACRSEPFTSQELSSGNLARRNLVPLLDDSYKQGPELAHQIVRPKSSLIFSDDTNDHTTPPPAPNCTWAYFTFHLASLTTLKSLATDSITPPATYISTDDALSAFIWQSVTRARLSRLDPNAKSTLARAVDVRRYLGLPQTYPGFMQNMTYHTYTIQELAEGQPLGAIASTLRSAVDPKTSSLAYNTRALATLIDTARDKNVVSFTATVDVSKDVMLSSWAGLECCGLDFNLGLGRPDAVRRPRFEPVESLIYLMPRTSDGGIAVGISLRDGDMERLRADERFGMYARYVG